MAKQGLDENDVMNTNLTDFKQGHKYEKEAIKPCFVKYLTVRQKVGVSLKIQITVIMVLVLMSWQLLQF